VVRGRWGRHGGGGLVALPPLPVVALYMYVCSECVVVCWSALECVAVCWSQPPLPVVDLYMYVYSGYVGEC